MNEKIIERVRKMLALAANSGATEGERDTALRHAHSYLAKYNLDLATVEAHTPEKKRREAEEQRRLHPVTFYGRPWARSVCTSVGRMLFCEYIFVAATKAMDTRHYFIGRHSNAVSAGLLAEFLVTSIMKEGKRRMRQGKEGNAWFRSFAWGSASAIRYRVEQLIHNPYDPAAGHPDDAPATPVATPGTSVVLESLYATEHAANRALVSTAFPKLRPGRTGKSIGDADAYADGVEYGRTVSLNHQLGRKS